MTDVLLSPTAKDQLDKLQSDIADRIRDALRDAANRPGRELKPLTGRNDHSLRVGDYRAIVDWDQSADELRVTEIGHRRNIYD